MSLMLAQQDFLETMDLKKNLLEVVLVAQEVALEVEVVLVALEVENQEVVEKLLVAQVVVENQEVVEKLLEALEVEKLLVAQEVGD
jgi:hypothetical protein